MHAYPPRLGLRRGTWAERSELDEVPRRPQRAENVELTASGGFRPPIGEVDHHTLFDAVDDGVRLIDEVLQAFGEPVKRLACRRSPFMPCWTTTHWPSSVTMKPWR